MSGPNVDPPDRHVRETLVEDFLGNTAWRKRLKSVNIPTEWMNTLVMNYLTTQGHARAAEQFQAETGTPQVLEPEGTKVRMMIRQALERGLPAEAIDQVVDLNPEIVEERPELLFRLKKQEFIELVGQGKTEEALEFAEHELARRIEEDASLLKELESAMALLLFEDPWKSPLEHLLGTSYRKETADELNNAILSSETKDGVSRLPHLIHLMMWMQNRSNDLVRSLFDKNPSDTNDDNDEHTRMIPWLDPLQTGSSIVYHDMSLSSPAVEHAEDMDISASDDDVGLTNPPPFPPPLG